MNNSSEVTYIKKCIALVEARLNWGDSQAWSTYDFEKLSDAIQEQTGISLSTTTLKRLWGKLKYDNIPAVTTLNTLAQFAGYADWRDFKQQPSAMPVEQAPPPPTKRRWIYWLAAPLPVVILLYLLVYRSQQPTPPGAYTFSSTQMVASGVPNSVVFNYKARAAGKTPVFISQSWDTSRKVQVAADLETYSCIYYTPGYFRAKLIVGNDIVKEHDLMIASDGWLAVLEKGKDMPIYFKKEEFDRIDSLVVNEALMDAYHIPMQPELPALRFFNVRDMGRLQTDHFSFETSLKSGYNMGAGACQGVQVLILCKNDVVTIPLCAKGCTGNISLYAAGVYVESANADLSGFGCDLNNWVQLRVETKNKHMRFFVNNREAYALTFNNNPADIVGVQYRFSGTGAIRQTSFAGADSVTRL